MKRDFKFFIVFFIFNVFLTCSTTFDYFQFFFFCETHLFFLTLAVLSVATVGSAQNVLSRNETRIEYKNI